MSEKFEVGIVGASVGGSICAQVLGEAGIKVALFDHSHPREKPCGGLVDLRTIEEFNIPNEYIENEVKWCRTERYFLRAKLSVNPSMFLVSRKEFDNYLLQRALKNNNVTFFPEKVDNLAPTQDKWSISTNKNTQVKVQFLIGADGCSSIVRKKVLEPIDTAFIATTVGYNFQCSKRFLAENFEPNTIEAYYSHLFVQKEGFIWIFPKENSVNVGIGGLAPGIKLKKALDDFLLYQDAGKRFSAISGNLYAGLIPIIRLAKFFDLPCTGSNWALIGDAAGHVNSIGGAGIYYAMKGGKLCAQALVRGDIKSFDTSWRQEYGSELYYATNNLRRYYGAMGPLIWFQYCLRSGVHF